MSLADAQARAKLPRMGGPAAPSAAESFGPTRSLVHGIGYVAGNFLGGAGRALRGTYQGAASTAKVLGQAAEHPTQFPGNLLKPAAHAAGRQAVQTMKILHDTVPTPSWLDVPNVAHPLQRKGAGVGVHQALHNIGKYPFETLMAWGSIVAPTSAIADRTALFRSISKANPELSPLDALRIANRESTHPGFAATKGLKGGIAPRVLKGRYAEAPGRMQSHSPLGRASQNVYDYGSQRLENIKPGMKGSVSRRAARQQQRLGDQLERRQNAELQRHERVIAKGLGTKGGLAGIRRNNPAYQGFVAAAEAPRTMTPRAAVETKIADLSGERALLSKQQAEARAKGLDAKNFTVDAKRLDKQLSGLTKVLQGDLLESPGFAQALESGKAISDHGTVLLARELGIPVEQLASAANQIPERWIAKGLITRPTIGGEEGALHPTLGVPMHTPEARFFFHHQQIASRMQRIGGYLPAKSEVIGVPRAGEAMKPHQRTLALYESGNVEVHPRVLSDLVKARQAVVRARSARLKLYAHGDPLQGEIRNGSWLIRNPLTEPTRIPPDVRAAIHDPEVYARMNAPENFVYHWGVGPKPVWAEDLQNVRVIPEGVARKMLPEAMGVTRQTGTLTDVPALLNSLTRTAIIYTPYGGTRYVVRNTVQNLIQMAITKPSSFLQVRKSLYALPRRDPVLFHKLQEMSGTISGAAGLPRIPHGGSYAGRITDQMVHGSRRVSSFLGAAADQPWRIAILLKWAKEYDFKTDARLHELADSTDPAIVRARDQIQQHTREDMIDFDTLTPYEREVISRYFFIYAFARGIAKYPAMFAREYPVRTAIGALAAAQQAREHPAQPGIPQTNQEMGTVGNYRFGWASPLDPLAQDIQTGIATARSQGKGPNLSALAGMAAPFVRSGLGAASGSVTGGWPGVAQIFVPGYSTYQRVAKGGSLGTQVTRGLGMNVEPSASSVARREADKQKINAAWQVVGNPSDDASQIVASHNAYEDYKDLYNRASFAAKDLGRTLTTTEKTLLLNSIAAKHMPANLVASAQEIQNAPIAKQTAYFKWLSGELFGPRNRLMSAAGRAKAAATAP